MKKLIISIVATASLALVAKAEVLNSTSFEGLAVGAITAENIDAFLDENNNRYWTGYSTDSDLEVKELGGEGGLSAKPENVVRPMTGDDSKALAIDVDTPLSRNIAMAEGAGVPQTIGNGLYFDSMVQFTATDAAPTVTDGDKLIVWLKEIPVEGGQPTYKLCVTAAELDSASAVPTYKPFETNKEVAPDTWHRLSIAAKRVDFFVHGGDSVPVTMFEVYLDSEKVETDGVLYSMVKYDASTYNPESVTSVSFQGKGVIDDLVWTNVDPIADSYTVIVTDEQLAGVSTFKYMIGNEKSAAISLAFDGADDVTGEAEISVPAGTKALTVILDDLSNDYELQGGTKTADGWVKPFTLVKGEPLELVVIEAQNPVAQIGNVTYTTLQAAVDAAEADATITVIANIVTAGPVTVNKQVTINLGGKTITASNDESGDGVFHVVAGGNLTLNGEGTVNALGPNAWCMAVWADGGRVIIEGGFYTNEGAKDDGPGNHFDLIYAKNGGSVEINGGTFKCQTPDWTLNRKNEDTTGGFVVTGGKFYQYDPSKIDTDDQPVTSWCPAGYEAKKDGDYYVVTKKVETVKPGQTAEVDTVEAANAVEIEVEVPTGVDITEAAYKAYFKKSIVHNTETGKYEVSAVLNEEVVTPVIAATTGEGGAVTPAISFGPDGKVTINISNELRGLFYGVKYATTVGGVETAAAIPGLTVTPKAGGTAGFFRVVVDFKEIPEPAADAE